MAYDITTSTDYIEFGAKNPGSLNSLTNTKPLRRPPSLSESFAWSAENLERAMRHAHSNTRIELLTPIPQGSLQSPPKPPTVSSVEIFVTRQALRFLFHIALISVFETVFFFMYVSTLEDNGINRTVDGFLGGFETSCMNFTPLERNLTNDAIAVFLNSSAILTAGAQATSSRALTNNALFHRAWIYVGCLGGLFALSVFYTFLRRIQIAWSALVAENLIFVALLASYEYMFFSTVIFPYTPINAPEIAANTVLELQSSCGLFLPP